MGKRKQNSSSSGKIREDALYSISYSMMRFAVLWKNMDCRALISQMDSTALVDELLESSETLIEHYQPYSHIEAVTRVCIAGSKSAIQCIYYLLLWSTRDVYKLTRDALNSKSPETNARALDGLNAATDTIISLREKLLDCLHSWLMLKVDEGQDSGLCDELNLEAFRLIGDLRVLFSSRNITYQNVHDLAWTPSQEILASMRQVFEDAGNKINAELADLGDSEEEGAAARALSRQLVSGLLAPMSIATVYNIESLNRRQAAAVLCHIVDDDDHAQEVMRVWIKRMKDFDPVKVRTCLHISLVLTCDEVMFVSISRFIWLHSKPSTTN
jgi:hypothetical protein